jgi:hypothetical protein
VAKLREKSLCRLVEDRILKKEPDAYKKLVTAPKFVCLKCGRAANRRKNLCNPTKI